VESYSASQCSSLDQRAVEIVSLSERRISRPHGANLVLLPSFEQEKWSAIEIEAINKHLETNSRPEADRAMEAIKNEWSQSSHVQASETLRGKCDSRRYMSSS
jgi:hypothetical protein